jgi:hypothetical protein
MEENGSKIVKAYLCRAGFLALGGLRGGFQKPAAAAVWKMLRSSPNL